MFCKYCGEEIDESASFCPKCGKALHENFNVPPAEQQQRGAIRSATNVLAVVGFILSFFVSIAGLICSIIGYKRANEYEGNGKGLALAGIIISSVELFFSVIAWLLLIGLYDGLLCSLPLWN